MMLGYARVSKVADHDTRMQETALRAAGAERVFAEPASGGRWDRPALHRMLEQLRVDDVVVVWKLDRLSRSLKDLLHIMERIEAVGAGFRSLTEAIDTTTPAGRMLMQMVGSFAEFERAMIRSGRGRGLWRPVPRGVSGDGARSSTRHNRRKFWPWSRLDAKRRRPPGSSGCIPRS